MKLAKFLLSIVGVAAIMLSVMMCIMSDESMTLHRIVLITLFVSMMTNILMYHELECELGKWQRMRFMCDRAQTDAIAIYEKIRELN